MFYIGVDLNGNIIECGTNEITTEGLKVYSFNNNAEENPFYFFSEFKTLHYKYVVEDGQTQIIPQYNYSNILIQEQLGKVESQLLDIQAYQVEQAYEAAMAAIEGE